MDQKLENVCSFYIQLQHPKSFYKTKNEPEICCFQKRPTKGTHGPDHFGLQEETADENFRAWGVETPRARSPGLM